MSDTRLLEIRNGLTFLECLQVCTQQKELIAEWERLSGEKLIASNPLDRMIDEATGYDLVTMGKFADFVYEYIFRRF